MKLTEQQQQIIDAKRSNLLVSAAAGAGKTSVMTRRIVERVLLGELDLQRVLVVTFTKRAAAHMRDKIEDALVAALHTTQDRQRQKILARQLSLLPSATISTVHAFCLDVVKNFIHERVDDKGRHGLEPGFETVEGPKRDLLLEQIIDVMLDDLYALYADVVQGESPDKEMPVAQKRPDEPGVPYAPLGSMKLGQYLIDFYTMTQAYFGGRHDEELKASLIATYNYVRSLPHYRKWLVEQMMTYDKMLQNFDQSEAVRQILAQFYDVLKRAVARAEKLILWLDSITFVKDAAKNEVYQKDLKNELQFVLKMADMLAAGQLNFDACVACGQRLTDIKRPKRDKRQAMTSEFLEAYVPIFEVLYYLRGDDKAIRIPTWATELFTTEAAPYFLRPLLDIQFEHDAIKKWIYRYYELVLQFDDRYSAAKQAHNQMDLTDYEHDALWLLEHASAGHYYRNKFDEIYVDEYQDTSKIQEAIIAAISQENCFAVGDVKQSIYRFRHACPALFLARHKDYGAKKGGTLYELNKNFRSDPVILDFVNHVFFQLMSEDLGEINYDASQQLFAGKTGDSTKGAINLMLIRKTGDEPDVPEVADETTVATEARAAAIKIQKLVNSGVALSDIAVLARGNANAAMYRKVLIDHGIMACGGTTDSYLESEEILLMENMLMLLDNACQDMPLAAIMTGLFPAAGFVPDDLLTIALYGREKNGRDSFFWEAVRRYADDGPDDDLAQKVRRFCEWVDDLRSRGMTLRIGELIEHIYIDTDIRTQVASMPSGEMRVGMLNSFRDWAIKVADATAMSLHAFVQHLSKIRDMKKSPEEFEPAQAIKNAVTCMTMHKSKGLEFPYVFLVATQTRMRTTDEKRPILASDDGGIGADFADPDQAFAYATLHKRYIAEKMKRANLAEEMRLLYVAMTRAEKELYIIGTVTKSKDESMGSISSYMRLACDEPDVALPPWLVFKATSHLDLLLLALARADQAKDAAIWGELPHERKRKLNIPGVCLEITDQQDLFMATTAKDDGVSRAEMKADSVPSDSEIRRIQLILSAQYPYEEQTRWPLKTTVSELKRKINDFSRPEDESDAAARPVNLTVRPVFSHAATRHETMTTAEIGTLMHSVYQYFDFASLAEAQSLDFVDALLSRLVQNNMISNDDLPFIAPYKSSLLAFLTSDICQRMLAAQQTEGNGPYREIPFSLASPRGEGEYSLIQGMIDCWFVDEGEAIIIDFKTDRLPDNEAEAILKQRYTSQLDYYALAVEAASGRKVKKKAIWWISGSRFIFL